MSFLNYFPFQNDDQRPIDMQINDRCQRDALSDLKYGLDLMYEFKLKLNKLHPNASETLIRLLSY